MATITNAQVEALARQLLWDQIEASTWHAGMTDEQRTAAIMADVEAWWHLRAGEAAQMLVDRAIAGLKSSRKAQEGLSVCSGSPPLPRSRNAA